MTSNSLVTTMAFCSWKGETLESGGHVIASVGHLPRLALASDFQASALFCISVF